MTTEPSETPERPSCPVPPGSVVDGKYRVERVLGQGAMGVVVAARHEALEQTVAIKFLLPDALERGEAVARFLRETRVVSRLSSAHVARVIDAGTMPDGSPYMVIEYLTGSDLAELLATRGPLPVKQAVDYALQALDAVGEAHSQGIVHRDLKPANLFLSRRADGATTLKVLDFGISKVTDEGGSASLTGTHAMMGSPLYMSPEQVLSAKQVDGRSDLWSLGAVLYELLSGQPPFGGTTVGEVLTAVLTRAPPALRDLRPEVPEGLSQIIARCLERPVELRPADAAALSAELLPYGSAGSQEILLRLRPLRDSTRRPPTATPSSRPACEPAPPRSEAPDVPFRHDAGGRRRGIAIAVTLVALLFAGVMATRWAIEPREGAPASTSR